MKKLTLFTSFLWLIFNFSFSQVKKKQEDYPEYPKHHIQILKDVVDMTKEQFVTKYSVNQLFINEFINSSNDIPTENELYQITKNCDIAYEQLHSIDSLSFAKLKRVKIKWENEYNGYFINMYLDLKSTYNMKFEIIQLNNITKIIDFSFTKQEKNFESYDTVAVAEPAVTEYQPASVYTEEGPAVDSAVTDYSEGTKADDYSEIEILLSENQQLRSELEYLQTRIAELENSTSKNKKAKK